MMSMLRTSYNHVFDLCYSSIFPDSFAMYLRWAFVNILHYRLHYSVKF